MVKACHLHIWRNELLSVFQSRGDPPTKRHLAQSKALGVCKLRDNLTPRPLASYVLRPVLVLPY
jgi:hypothetical protein